MLDYSMARPNKNKIICTIALISIILSQLTNSLITTAETEFNYSLPFTIMASAIYAVLWTLFNKFLWNKGFFKYISNTPDLNGKWFCNGQGKKHDDPNANNLWQANIEIKQTFSEISIHMKTISNTSQSISIGATIEKNSDDLYTLSYPYKNSLINADPDMQAHDGFCQLVFNMKEQTADGYYYTNSNRKSYGGMNLKKIISVR